MGEELNHMTARKPGSLLIIQYPLVHSHEGEVCKPALIKKTSSCLSLCANKPVFAQFFTSLKRIKCNIVYLQYAFALFPALNSLVNSKNIFMMFLVLFSRPQFFYISAFVLNKRPPP